MRAREMCFGWMLWRTWEVARFLDNFGTDLVRRRHVGIDSFLGMVSIP